MICPTCGSSKLNVIETRHTADNTIRRRRSCENCGNRFTSYELTAQSLKENNDMIRNEIRENVMSHIDKQFDKPISSIEKKFNYRL